MDEMHCMNWIPVFTGMTEKRRERLFPGVSGRIFDEKGGSR
jgi:hypothetical protein